MISACAGRWKGNMLVAWCVSQVVSDCFLFFVVSLVVGSFTVGCFRRGLGGVWLMPTLLISS